MGSVSARESFAKKGMEIFGRMRGERSSVFDGKSLSGARGAMELRYPTAG